MKQHQQLTGSGLLVIAVVTAIGLAAEPSSASVIQDERWRIVVTVTSADRNEPVESASVSVKYIYDPAFSPIRLDTLTTDQTGQVYIIPATMGGFLKVKPKAGSRFDITIRHPDYVETYRNVPVRKDTKAGDIPVSVSLKRKAGGKLVAVQVVDAGDGAPIYDASVKLKGTISPTLFSGTTNAGGRALITVSEADNYEVTVTHTGYESINTTLSVKMYDEQKEYDLSFKMQPTNRQERTLRVFVRGKDKQGKTGPVRYAQVTLPSGQTKTTNYDGEVEFKHRLTPGEEARVEAEATFYKPGSATFTVGVRGLAGDTVTINLEREVKDGCDGFAGTWKTSFGTMTFTISGSEVRASYDFDGGSIVGNLSPDGRTLNGRYKENEAQGNFRFTLSADGQSFTGRWNRTSGKREPPSGAWEGKCVQPK